MGPGLMSFEPKRLLCMQPLETIQEYDVRDVILYALGIGVGVTSAIAPETLRFAYEDNIEVLPTIASVLASPGFWLRDAKFGIDWKRITAGEESLMLHNRLPVAGSITSIATVDDLFDKGADKGAVLYWRRELYDTRSGVHLATELKSSFLRGDGGKGGRTAPSPPLAPIPDRPSDLQIAIPTRDDQALLYRLSGDFNPLHIDPKVAKEAHFDRPILHGLCTFGVAGRAVIDGLALAVASSLKSLRCRFSSPVYPGETITTEVWKTEPGLASFRCRVAERDVTVLTNGHASYVEEEPSTA